MKNANVTVIDPVSYLIEMIPHMAAHADKLTRLDIAEKCIEALSQIEIK